MTQEQEKVRRGTLTGTGRTMMGTYELVRRLGAGGMGEVWLARQRGAAGFNRNVAIKRLLPQAMDQPDVVQMFIEEAQITGQLRHPNVVNVIELGAAQTGELYLVLEHVDGTGLHRLLRDKASHPSVGSALMIGRDVALALHAAHTLTDEDGIELGLVHRDVTPSNVMVDRHGHVKLMDFGIAKVKAKSKQTEAGIIKGKLAYLAPEQLRGEVDMRSDLFSLGLVVWEIIAGEPARSADTEAMLMAKVGFDEIPSIHTKRPDLPDAVVAVVDKSVAVEPSERFQSGEQMAQAMLQALEALPERNKTELAREDLAALVKSATKSDATGAAVNTNASRTVDEHRVSLTLHSLVVQQDGVTLSRPLTADMISLRPPADIAPAGSSSQSRAATGQKRSAVLPLTAIIVAVAIAVGSVAVRRSRTREPARHLQSSPLVASLQPRMGVLASSSPLENAPTRAALGSTSTLPGSAPATADAGVTSTSREHVAAGNSASGPSAARTSRGRSGPRLAARTIDPNTPATLRLTCRPWCRVWVDGESKGVTPMAPMSLRAGSHSVRVVNDRQDIQADRSFQIQLAPGEDRSVVSDMTTLR